MRLQIEPALLGWGTGSATEWLMGPWVTEWLRSALGGPMAVWWQCAVGCRAAGLLRCCCGAETLRAGSQWLWSAGSLDCDAKHEMTARAKLPTGPPTRRRPSEGD